MKKLILIFLLASLLILLFVPSVWNWFTTFWSNSNNETSQLVVKSISGDYSIYLDNEKIGEVKDKDSKLFPKISSGEKKIKIIRSSETLNLYFVLEKEVNFLPSAQVEIEWSAGPTLESSEGIIKYFEAIDKKNGAEVNITTFPRTAKVKLNDNEINKNISITNTQSNKLTIIGDDPSYNSKEIDIKLVDAATEIVPNNIRLNIEVYLYKRPIE